MIGACGACTSATSNDASSQKLQDVRAGSPPILDGTRAVAGGGADRRLGRCGSEAGRTRTMRGRSAWTFRATRGTTAGPQACAIIRYSELCFSPITLSVALTGTTRFSSRTWRFEGTVRADFAVDRQERLRGVRPSAGAKWSRLLPSSEPGTRKVMRQASARHVPRRSIGVWLAGSLTAPSAAATASAVGQRRLPFPVRPCPTSANGSGRSRRRLCFELSTTDGEHTANNSERSAIGRALESRDGDGSSFIIIGGL
jgi:hypothetical protein